MIKIPLTMGKFALIDDDIAEEIQKYKWQIRDPGINVSHRTLYAVHNYKRNGKPLATRMHRLIYELKTGKNIDGKVIDHINHDGLDNRINNLREATHKQNISHQRHKRGNSSQYKGVRWNTKNKNWNAYIKTNYKRIHLGCFENEADAAEAYNKAAVKLFGEYAVLNEVER
jgi:hypothetical protein